MPTKGHEGHDMGKPEGIHAHPSAPIDDNNPGYEIQDVNTGGIATFLAGLFGFVLIFFVFCFFMGKAINYALLKQDGQPNRWQPNLSQAGVTPHGDKREDLTSNVAIEQKQLAAMTQTFPTPRLESDDGNQDLADLHAKEDLLLDHYSSSPDQPSGTIRIPIERAMQLVVQRGLPAAPNAPKAPTTYMAGDSAPTISAPLTNGFARTGYELDVMRQREEKNDFNRAEAKKD